MQAWSRGEATPDQQKRVIDYIVVMLGGYNSVSFHPGSDGGRAMAFAEGRRFVAIKIIEMTKTNLSTIEDKPK